MFSGTDNACIPPLGIAVGGRLAPAERRASLGPAVVSSWPESSLEFRGGGKFSLDGEGTGGKMHLHNAKVVWQILVTQETTLR